MALSPWAAQGQPATNPAAAEELFRKALAEEDAGRWERACELYVASFKLDASVGTQLNVGRCAEHFGKIATAWAEFQKARALNQHTPEPRRAEVQRFLDEADARLEKRVPYVTIDIRARPEGLVVTSDGAELPTGSLGVAIPLDPGRHELVLAAPGYTTERRTVELAEGQRVVVNVALEKAPVVVAPPPPPIRRPPPDDSRRAVHLGAGIGLAATGGLSLVAALVTGVVAHGKRSSLDELLVANGGSCTEEDATLSCTSTEDHDRAVSLSGDGQKLATASTVLLFAGAALAATGIVVSLTAPRAPALRVGVAALASVRPGAVVTIGGELP